MSARWMAIVTSLIPLQLYSKIHIQSVYSAIRKNLLLIALYMYIYIYMCVCVCVSSSSSCPAISTDFSDPLSPSLPIINRFRQALRATSRIYTELLYVGSSWSCSLCSAIWRGPQEYIIYEHVSTSPAVSYMSGSSNFYSFRFEWYVAVQLLLCGVLSPGLLQYCSQHYCVIAVKLFLRTFR